MEKLELNGLLTQISQWYPVCAVYKIFFCNRPPIMNFPAGRAQRGAELHSILLREDVRQDVIGEQHTIDGPLRRGKVLGEARLGQANGVVVLCAELRRERHACANLLLVVACCPASMSVCPPVESAGRAPAPPSESSV